MVDLSRRGFFRGKPRPKAEIRPPWALAEVAFVDRCTRCGDCIAGCPQRIIVSGDGAYPTIDFARGECTFCGDCVNKCPSGAISRADNEQVAWLHKAVIGEDCLARRGIECRVCGDFCDTRAIRFPLRPGGTSLAEVETARCTGCGACVAPCPVASISLA